MADAMHVMKMAGGAHREHDVDGEEEDGDVALERERDEVRDARERRERGALDHDGSSACVRAAGLAADAFREGPPGGVDAARDERGGDDVERDDARGVADAEVSPLLFNLAHSVHM